VSSPYIHDTDYFPLLSILPDVNRSLGSKRSFHRPNLGVSRVQKITTCLWFPNQAEEAMQFYVSIFPQAKVTHVVRCGDAGPGPKGSFLFGAFAIDDIEIQVLNGAPSLNFTPAMSLSVNCETQAEIDLLWQKLTEDGSEVQCGWLTDKYGISWQIVPSIIGKLMTDPDPVRTARLMQAMFPMVKLDIAKLQAAFDGE
jgi:predicted 3-demethylubiquinone-9 3-methyltransferase (glyoxalase superfamily)